MTSCVVSDYPGGPVTPVTTSLSFGTYDTLPASYVGGAYYHQNRYFYGGNYQRGRYFYQGRYYNDRYYHGGRYYYGGRHEIHVRKSPQPPRPSNAHRLDHRDRDRVDKHNHGRR